MTTYAAFFRAINVGKRKVPMPALGSLLSGLGHSDVRTLLNSGNAVFETASRKKSAALEAEIELAVATAFGFTVETLLRSVEQLREIVSEAGTLAERLATATHPKASIQVYFLREPLAAGVGEKIRSFASAEDVFVFRDTEFLWLTTRSILDAPFGNYRLPHLHTARNLNTVVKVLALCEAEGADKKSGRSTGSSVREG